MHAKYWRNNFAWITMTCNAAYLNSVERHPPLAVVLDMIIFKFKIVFHFKWFSISDWKTEILLKFLNSIHKKISQNNRL